MKVDIRSLKSVSDAKKYPKDTEFVLKDDVEIKPPDKEKKTAKEK